MKILIIGAGNIGGAIACGIYNKGVVKPEELTCSDLIEQNLINLQAKCPGINVTQDNIEAIKQNDIIIVAVKPWVIEPVLGGIKEALNPEKHLLLSIVAGVNFEKLDRYLGGLNIPTFRVIPNIAIEVGSSMTFVSADKATTEQQDLVVEMFDKLGKAYLIKENLMSAGTAVASSGIAFALRYIRAASEGGVELGFYPEQAKEIVMMTAQGAVDILRAHNSNPEQEIDKVTTPGGITIRGLNTMEMAGFTNSVIKGILASKSR